MSARRPAACRWVAAGVAVQRSAVDTLGPERAAQLNDLLRDLLAALAD